MRTLSILFVGFSLFVLVLAGCGDSDPMSSMNDIPEPAAKLVINSSRAGGECEACLFPQEIREMQGYYIRGTVNILKVPTPWASVRLYNASGSLLGITTTDAQGTYQFIVKYVGWYSLMAIIPRDEGNYAVGVNVRVSWPETITNKDIVITKEIHPISPAIGQVVDTLRPTLTWTPLPEARDYVLQVIVNNSTTVLFERHLKEASYALGFDLELDTEYTWYVIGMDADGNWVGNFKGAFKGFSTPTR